MKAKGIIIIVVVLALVLVGLIIKSKFFGGQGPGALQISTTPTATVFLDGSQVGVTPYFDDKIKSGEHTVKLVPELTGENLTSWEGKVTLLPGILTSIKRTFAVNDSESSGEIITLEKAGRKDQSSLAVISIPDQAVVKLNGEPQGFTPLSLEDLVPADYQITISSSGYEEKTVAAHTVGGYKLIVNVKLAQTMEGIEEATASGEGEETEEEAEEETEESKATPPSKPYVKVKDTPTGFLRVRLGPSTASTEAAQIKPGAMYPYLDEEDNGWYKIEYEKDEEGWVSGVYVDLIK
jgi:hypothetical protein